MELRKFIATTIREYLNENVDGNSDILYHATNSTWTKPEMSGLGFHAGTLKAAKDRMKSFRMNINPYIKMFRFHLKNPLYIGRDYRFHRNIKIDVDGEILETRTYLHQHKLMIEFKDGNEFFQGMSPKLLDQSTKWCYNVT